MNAYTVAHRVIGTIKAEIGEGNVPMTLRREIRRIVRAEVPSDKWCKGDWIEEIMFMAGDRHLNGKHIKTIDIALPEKTRLDMHHAGVNYQYFVTVYYEDGTVEYADVMGLWARLDNMGRLS